MGKGNYYAGGMKGNPNHTHKPALMSDIARLALARKKNPVAESTQPKPTATGNNKPLILVDGPSWARPKVTTIEPSRPIGGKMMPDQETLKPIVEPTTPLVDRDANKSGRERGGSYNRDNNGNNGSNRNGGNSGSGGNSSRNNTNNRKRTTTDAETGGAIGEGDIIGDDTNKNQNKNLESNMIANFYTKYKFWIWLALAAVGGYLVRWATNKNKKRTYKR